MTATTARHKHTAPPGRFDLSRRERPPNTQEPSIAAASLDAWFDHALPRIYGYFITRVGGDVQAAEDLTQETMLAAVDSRGLATADEPIAWLFGIARHKLLDHYRRNQRLRDRVDVFDSSALESVPDDRSLPELDLDSVQTRDAIVETLQHLPPRQRSAMVLRYLDGLAVPTTAAMLGISVHAAESLIARGRRAFRHHYLRLTEGR